MINYRLITFVLLVSSHNQTFRHLLIATIQDDVKVIQKDEKFELYLFNRPIRKVYLLGTIVDLRLKNGRDHTTRGEH